jgi:hypothetical protein
MQLWSTKCQPPYQPGLRLALRARPRARKACIFEGPGCGVPASPRLANLSEPTRSANRLANRPTIGFASIKEHPGLAMIHDATAKTEIVQQWIAVKALCRGSHRQYVVPGGTVINETPPDDFDNLPFILAYAVLDQVLDALMDQSAFPRPPGRRPMLGHKMSVSRAHLPWVDYKLVDEGKDARNRVAHDAALTDKKDCLRYIDGIEGELTSWGIL